MKQLLLRFWLMDRFIVTHVAISRWFYFRVPLLGRGISAILDRMLLYFYGIDLRAFSINVKQLSIAHPVGVLLGGNGIYSAGRVTIMAGVKFVSRNPKHEEYLARHAKQRVFVLGDNVVIGANSVVIGPVDICDNVLVGAMSLVNKSILEPGVYVGVPVRKVAEESGDDWVSHMGPGR